MNVPNSKKNLGTLFKEKNRLIKEIKYHDFLYHNKNSPIISDHEYDLLKEDLKKVEREIAIFSGKDLTQVLLPILEDVKLEESLVGLVGYSPDEKFKKIAHIRPMLSLQHTFDSEKIGEFVTRIKKLLTQNYEFKNNLKGFGGDLDGDLKVDPDASFNAGFAALLNTNSDFNLDANFEDMEFICEPKIDGVSFSILYENGEMQYAVTRGNGIYGEDITANVMKIEGIPKKIDFMGKIELRGEVYISKSNFDALNNELHKQGLKTFANPRNAASGSLRQLNSQITADRRLSYFIWGGYLWSHKQKLEDQKLDSRNLDGQNLNSRQNLGSRNLGAQNLETRELDGQNLDNRNLEILESDNVKIDDLNLDKTNTINTQKDFLEFAAKMGFSVYKDLIVTNKLEEMMLYYEKNLSNRANFEFDIDGVVYKVNNLKYQEILGNTAKEPRWAIAYKFDGQTAVTQIRDITVQISRNGNATPVAELIPVNVGGVIVSRATLHNPKILKNNDYRVGDKVLVKRAGDVIPQIITVFYDQRDESSQRYIFPKKCPSCNSTLEVVSEDETSIKCPASLKCDAQAVENMLNFVSRNAFNIIGLGRRQIEQLLQWKVIRTPLDILLLQSINLQLDFPLQKREGWGEKSVEKLFENIENSKIIHTANFIYALAINGIGLENAKNILKSIRSYSGSFKDFLTKVLFQSNSLTKESEEIIREIFINSKGIGIAIADSFIDFFKNDERRKLVEDIVKEIRLLE